MKIVVILVFTVLCALRSEAAVCLCGFQKDDRSKATTINTMHNSMFCCIQPSDIDKDSINYNIMGSDTYQRSYNYRVRAESGQPL